MSCAANPVAIFLTATAGLASDCHLAGGRTCHKHSLPKLPCTTASPKAHKLDIAIDEIKPPPHGTPRTLSRCLYSTCSADGKLTPSFVLSRRRPSRLLANADLRRPSLTCRFPSLPLRFTCSTVSPRVQRRHRCCRTHRNNLRHRLAILIGDISTN
jgi:hypothetical protein